MTSREAKEILLLYRPGTDDATGVDVIAALELARRDPELARWFERHCAFQNAMRAGFRSVPVPQDRKAALIARQNVVRPAVWWRQPLWLQAAAAVLLVLGLAALWLRPASPDRFANYRARMVSTALREYRMDVVTNDLRQVRQFLSERGAPGDFALTAGLEKLQLTGAGLLRWRTHPVAMVCFNRGDNQMLFLFVMNRTALKDPPGEAPNPSTVTELQTFSWTRGQYTYVLAAPLEPGDPTKYL
jgi:uncharacterized membrane protein YbaN (DUF454 family)